jgi:hypothetical protein
VDGYDVDERCRGGTKWRANDVMKSARTAIPRTYSQEMTGAEHDRWKERHWNRIMLSKYGKKLSWFWFSSQLSVRNLCSKQDINSFSGVSQLIYALYEDTCPSLDATTA